MASYNTQPRKLLLSFLQANPDKLFSPKEIAAALHGQPVSVSAVYRNLAALEASGSIVREVRSGSREVLYRSQDNAVCRNALHMTCTQCGRTLHMDSAVARQMIDAVLAANGFVIEKAGSHLYGRCKACG